MPNKVGDKLKSAIKRGGLKDVEITVTRATGGAVTLSLTPAMNSDFYEEQIVSEGLNGKINVLYYKQTLKLQYLQSDKDTLADLFQTSFDEYFHTSGTSTKITFLNSEYITLTMYFKRQVRAPGYAAVMLVDITATSTSLTPAFR